jgi:hypothetical protein
VLVYGWLAAGWPLAALGCHRVRTTVLLRLPVTGRSESLPYLVGFRRFDLGVDDERGGEMISRPIGLAELR